MVFNTTLLVERLKLFTGSEDDGYRLALEDADQFVIDSILAWRGNPELRSTLEFEVRFADGDIVWKPWDLDLSNSQPFEEYCRKHKPLYSLLFTTKVGAQEARRINSSPITDVQPGTTVVFVDIRHLNTKVYDEDVTLDDKFHHSYVIRATYTKWDNRAHTLIELHMGVFNFKYRANNLFVFLYGSITVFSHHMIEVTPTLLLSHPSTLLLISDKTTRAKISKKYLTPRETEGR